MPNNNISSGLNKMQDRLLTYAKKYIHPTQEEADFFLSLFKPRKYVKKQFVVQAGEVLGVDTNLYFGVGYMNVSPQRYFFIPYYSLAITSFFVHMACIHKIKMSEYVTLSTAQNQSIGIMVLGVIFTVLIITKMAHLQIPVGAIKKLK